MSTNHNSDAMQLSETPTPERLYQETPRRYNTYIAIPWKRSWTRSRESYQNAAKREFDLLKANPRTANHEIVIGYLKEFPILEIREQFSRIKEWLRRHRITAYIVTEITRDGQKKPTNKIHYHCLIDSRLSVRRLRCIFNQACQYAGLQRKEDYRVMYSSLSNRGEFLGKARYILKYGPEFFDKTILFRPKRDFSHNKSTNKIHHIRWFIDADGNSISKADLWKSLVGKWYPKETDDVPQEATQRRSVKIRLRFGEAMPTDGTAIDYDNDKDMTLWFQ